MRMQSCITAGKAGLSDDLDASFVRYVQSVLRLTLSEKFVLKNFMPRACDGGNTKGRKCPGNPIFPGLNKKSK